MKSELQKIPVFSFGKKNDGLPQSAVKPLNMLNRQTTDREKTIDPENDLSFAEFFNFEPAAKRAYNKIQSRKIECHVRKGIN